MIGKLGLPELLLILVIALLIFGPGKLASVGKSLGEAIRSFKSAFNEPEKPEQTPEKKPE
jgi:sec-independent protein translocase protein TatA